MSTTNSNQTAELSLDYDDIEGPVTLPVLRDRVEEIVQENLVYRDVFRQYDATNIASNVVQIPVPKDDGAHPKIVDEGAEFPRSHEEYDLQELTFDKFGFEVPLTMEAVNDSRIDLTQDQIDRQARQMAEDINARAFSHIDDALRANGRTEGGNNGTMTYDDLLQGRENLLQSSYNPDMLIGDVSAIHDLKRSDNFLEHGSDEQADMRRNGPVGRVLGMTVMEDNSGLPLGGTSNPGALMVDTDVFGYEGERDPVTTEEYNR